MGEFIIKNWIEVLFGLISAGALAFCKYLWNQNKAFKALQKENENQKYRKMILDEIEPIQEELERLHQNIIDTDDKTHVLINNIKQESELTHEHMYEDLNSVQNKNDRNFKLILNSYKFRLIQLCKTHLRDNYITEDDFEQISEMYKLYHELGGNGQAQDYYNKVLALSVRKSEE